jgi:hypothetical protein
VLQTLITYVATTLQPWIWPAAYVAAASFVLFWILRLWACGPGFRLVKRTRAAGESDTPPGAGRRVGGAFLRGFVWVVAFGSTLLRRLSMTCALVAVVGFAAVSLVSPARASARDALLSQAQQALQGVLPAGSLDAAALGSPQVTANKDGSTTYTFRIPPTGGAKSAKAKTYSVTIGPGGVEVKQKQ